jgi:uncharacterized membrane protein YqiK
MTEFFSSHLSLPLGIAVLALAGAVLFHRSMLRLFGVVLVPESNLAMINKKYVLVGEHKALPQGAIIALKGEAGWQADTLAPGLYYGYWPWQYEIKLQPFTIIPEGEVGLLEARDGEPLTTDKGRVLGRAVTCDSFQDARAFLLNGGERGPQLAILPPGVYRINTALFSIETDDVIAIPQDKVGIITTLDGKPLPAGAIAGGPVEGHNSFQNAQAFIVAGGYKGVQEQVILAGRYYMNSLFVKVDLVDMTTVPIAHVGVVIAYVGRDGKDLTGDSFKHGNLVGTGERGVCVEPLDPGRYPINTRTHKVENVPTANVVLNWATGKNESHKLDEKLSTITVRSHDGFTFNLDVSQIIHVPRSEAPKVIARFGSMQNLVTQVLEPTIGNYFRNAGQASDVIDFLKERQQRQQAAKDAITGALADYNVVAVDTLIGDITPPPELMKTLTDKKLAETQKKTYETQQLAQESRKALEQATAVADTQKRVVDAERTVQIKEFEAQAVVKAAEGEAEAKTINAKADAQVTELNGSAEAGRLLAIGKAEAEVTQKKIDSMESGNYALIQIARELANSHVPLVPSIVSGGGGGGSNLVETLLMKSLVEQMNRESAKERELTAK